MEYAEAVEALKIQLTANQRSVHTRDSYLRDAELLRRWLEAEGLPLVVEAITPSMLLRFAASKACSHKADGSPRKPSSVDKIKFSLRAFFGSLCDAALIPSNPGRIFKYRRGRLRVPETLTEDESSRLVEAVAGKYGWRDEVILELFLKLGLRIEALSGLDVGDVRLDEGRIVLRHQKGGDQVAKAIPGSLKQRLAGYLETRLTMDVESDALFISNWGTRLSTRQVRAMVVKRGRQAGISKRVTPHLLRRTMATRLYEQTKDLLLVQRALDHAFVGTTQKYAKTSESAVVDACVSFV